MWKKNRLYNLQILQTDFCEKRFSKKKKRQKTHMLPENNQAAHMSSQKKKTPIELPKLKRNKVISTQDRANIMKIIPTLPSTSLPKFHQKARQDRNDKVG